MKIDKFTKIILTIIAINLTAITLKSFNLFAVAKADGITKGNITSKNYGLVPLNADGTVNVKIRQNEPLEVKLVGIDESPYFSWDAIKVKSDN